MNLFRTNDLSENLDIDISNYLDNGINSGIDAPIETYQQYIIKDDTIFDGHGHTITLYTSDASDESSTFQGLFNIISGTICNLKVKIVGNLKLISNGWIASCSSDTTKCVIKNCEVEGEGIMGDNCGLIIGGDAPNCVCIISNCVSSCDINGKQSGGIACLQSACEIINCSTYGQICGEDSGGIIGGICNGCKIFNSTSSGDITGTFCGGIVGSYDSSDSSELNGLCEIICCVATGDIRGQNCGGIAGGNLVYESSQDLIINSCMVTSFHQLNINSGRVIGSNAKAIIENTSYYADINSKISGINCHLVTKANHLSKTIGSVNLYVHRSTIKSTDRYDGFHALTVNNAQNDYGLRIDRLQFNHNNLHPLSHDYDKREVAHAIYQESNELLKTMVFAFTFKNLPVHKMVRMWIPNTDSTGDYAVYYKNNVDAKYTKISNLHLIKNVEVNTINGCNLWEFYLGSTLSKSKSQDHKFVIIAR